MTRRTVSWPVLLIAMAWVAFAAACGGPKVVTTPKAGVQTYPPVATSDVAQFESTPEKGSYIEMADISIEDEIKCDVGQAFEEEKALGVIEDLRRANPDMADVTDITMLELLAEKGKIERDDICTLQARFTRKEEKTAFITEALKGVNLSTLTIEAGEMGANAIMKIAHNDWQVKQKPSSFGADGTQAPGLKIGVKSTAVAIHYEGPEGGQGEAVSEKVLVVIKDKGEEGEEEEAAEEEQEEEEAAEETKTKETPPKPVEAAKLEKGKAEAAVVKKEEKKEDATLQSAVLVKEAEKKAAELKAAEDALKKKQDEQKALKAGITKDKESVDALNKQYIALKIKAAKARKEEEKAKAEEEKKAKAMAKKLEAEKKDEAKAAAASTKEAEKAAEEAAKAKEKEAKKEDKAAEKEAKGKEKEEKKAEKGKEFVPAEGKEGEAEEADVSEAVKEAKTKLKDKKSTIFDCLHNAKVTGAIQVTFLFKPSGAIDALGFLPEAPESAHKCIMQILSKEKFPEAARYYKAIFKYTLK